MQGTGAKPQHANISDAIGRSRKRLVDEKELLDENKIRPTKVMIFSMSRLMERFYKETNQDSKEEAEVFEDDFVEEDFCMKQKQQANQEL